MITRTARLASTITIAMLACSGCERRSPNPPDSGRRTQANVPLFATLYVDDHDVCSQAAYPEEPVRARVGDKVTFQVLNTCKDSELNVSLVVTGDGDPFNQPPKTDYTIDRIKFGELKKFPVLTVGSHAANANHATKLYRFKLKFNNKTVDPRLEVDP